MQYVYCCLNAIVDIYLCSLIYIAKIVCSAMDVSDFIGYFLILLQVKAPGPFEDIVRNYFLP